MLKPLIALLACAGSLVAHAQYPARPVRLVVASVPGSAPDVLARILAEQTAESLKLVVETSGPQALAELVRADIARYRVLGARLNIEPN